MNEFDTWIKETLGVTIAGDAPPIGFTPAAEPAIFGEEYVLQERLKSPMRYPGRERDEARLKELQGEPVEVGTPPDKRWSPVPAQPAKPQPQSRPGNPDSPLGKAAGVWIQTRTRMAANLGQLKGAILSAFAGEAPKLIADLQKKITKLDELTTKLDQGLADVLNNSSATTDPNARSKERNQAMAILAKFRSYLKSQEKFIAQIEANPFNVALKLKQEITAALDQAGKALG